MSFTDWKEVTISNAGSATRYGSDDLLDWFKILNNKVVGTRKPQITNPWRWNSYQEIKQMAAASVPTPSAADVVHFFLDSADNKVKLKKTGGTVVNLEDVGSGTWAPTGAEQIENKTIPINLNTIKHSTTNSAGDILVSDGTSYQRLSKGSANQVLATNAAGTTLEWQTVAGGGGGGEANTASSVGSAGIGTTAGKVGVDLQFKKLYSPDASINISDDVSNQKIDFTLGSGIVKTTQQNTYGDFDQIYKSARLRINNPANTFAYSIVGSALGASRNATLPLLTANDQFTFDNHTTTLLNKTLGSGTIANTDTITLKHSTTNNVGELLVSTGVKYDRKAKGSADTFLKVNSSGTDIEWASPSSFGGVKLPDGTIAATTGRWGAFYGGAGNGFGMLGFGPSYARLAGTATSATESATEIYTAAGTNQIAEFKTGRGFRRDSTCIFKAKWYLKSSAGGKVKIGLSDANALPAGGSGTANIRYDKVQDASGHLEFDTYSRRAVQFNAGASGLGESVTEVTVRFRKYGSPSGSATVCVRKGSDDTIAATIGTFTPSAFGSGEQEANVSNFSNTYVMVSGDRMSIEFPANGSNGIELDEAVAAVSGYTSQQYDGSWATTGGGATIACQIKCSAGGGTSGNTPLSNSNGIMIHGTIGTHTNYQIARNNGAASATVQDSGKALANTSTHTCEINMNATNITVTVDGTAFTAYTTNIPATTTPLAWFFHIETESATERGLGIVYGQVVLTS